MRWVQERYWCRRVRDLRYDLGQQPNNEETHALDSYRAVGVLRRVTLVTLSDDREQRRYGVLGLAAGQDRPFGNPSSRNVTRSITP